MTDTSRNAKVDLTLGIETSNNVPHEQKNLPDFKLDDDGLEETAGTSYEEEEVGGTSDSKEDADDLDEYEDELNS